jgi:tryptophan synthase beta chain
VEQAKLRRLFVGEVARHEFSGERFITIPEEVRSIYSIWRPTTLVRAVRLEEALGTPARIYYKNETGSPSGSHKANAAVPQAYFARKESIRRLVGNTTAGQWGCALAFACSVFGLGSTIYMSRSSYETKPYRKGLAEAWGAEVVPSPSERTDAGRNALAKNPGDSGTLGLAVAESQEDAMGDPTARCAVGSVFNFVLANQTVVGQEALAQMERLDEYPDIVIGCIGGGSNFSGLFWPFYREGVAGKSPKEVEFVAAESTAAPRMTRGEYMYDHVDAMGKSSLNKMYSLGHTYVPPDIHSAGLRTHASAPTLSLLVRHGVVRAVAYNQLEVFEAGTLFARTEGVLPAPESAHAVKAVIDEAKRCKESGERKVILFNLCGHGHLDLQSYQEYFSGGMASGDADPQAIVKALEEAKNLHPWLQTQG